MGKILLVGDSLALLAPRAAVLAKMVSNVTCCNPFEFSRMTLCENFALVVLCHSLKEDDLLLIASEARRRWPQARLLHIWEKDRQLSPVEQHVDAIAATEPRRLAETIATMLAKPVATQSTGSTASSA